MDSPQTIKKRRVKPEPDPQKYATINVTNDLLASPSRHGHNHDTMFVTSLLRGSSGKPQFTAMEERIIGLNESRALYQNFEANEGFNNVPIAFLGCARKTHFMYHFYFEEGIRARHPLRSRIHEQLCLNTPEIVRQEYSTRY